MGCNLKTNHATQLNEFIPEIFNDLRCRECGTKEGVLRVYDTNLDTILYLCGHCYLDLYGV